MKVLQGATGHSTIGTTLDIYAHLTSDMQDAVASAMGRAFAKSS